MAGRCDVLLVEGSGGLLVPLGKNYTVRGPDLEAPLPRLLSSARNRLGTINHTLLTVKALQAVGIKRFNNCNDGWTKSRIFRPVQQPQNDPKNGAIGPGFFDSEPRFSGFDGGGYKNKCEIFEKNSCANFEG